MNFPFAGFALAGMACMLLSSAPAVRAATAAPAEWPHFRGPNHNGVTSQIVKPWAGPGPKRLWKRSVGKGYSSITVAGGRVYTMGNEGDKDTVWCLDAATGKPFWKHVYACLLRLKGFTGRFPGSRSTPIVDGQRVYSLSQEGHLFCLDARGGKVIWSKYLPRDLGFKAPSHGYTSSPLIQGELLVLNAGSAGAALDKASGRTVWKSPAGAGGYATPVPITGNGRRNVALFVTNAVLGIDPASGRELWRHAWKTKHGINAADPIVSGNTVFISSGYGQGCALLRLRGNRAERVWKNKELKNHFSCSVLHAGYVYGFDGDVRRAGDLRCIELETGALKWSERSVRGGTVILAGGMLVLLSRRGELVLARASPDAFAEVARTQLLCGKCWASPALAGGRLYARNHDGDLVCVDVGGK